MVNAMDTINLRPPSGEPPSHERPDYRRPHVQQFRNGPTARRI